MTNWRSSLSPNRPPVADAAAYSQSSYDLLDWVDVRNKPQSWPRVLRTAVTPSLLLHSEKQKRALREFESTKEMIEASRYMLSLTDDWDDEGASVITNEVWRLAVDFVENVALWANKYRDMTLGKLSISPLHSGGIDLYWENSFSDLLLTVPPEGNLGMCYGQNRLGEVFRGAVNLKECFPELIITWLKQKNVL